MFSGKDHRYSTKHRNELDHAPLTLRTAMLWTVASSFMIFTMRLQIFRLFGEVSASFTRCPKRRISLSPWRHSGGFHGEAKSLQAPSNQKRIASCNCNCRRTNPTVRSRAIFISSILTQVTKQCQLLIKFNNNNSRWLRGAASRRGDGIKRASPLRSPRGGHPLGSSWRGEIRSSWKLMDWAAAAAGGGRRTAERRTHVEHVIRGTIQHGPG